MYQKCVDRIVIEENQWKHKGGMPYQVSIYFKWRKKVNEFRYCPRFDELRDVIKKLIKLYGYDQVYKEVINMSIWDVLELGKCPCSGDVVDGRCERCGLRVVVYEGKTD